MSKVVEIKLGIYKHTSGKNCELYDIAQNELDQPMAVYYEIDNGGITRTMPLEDFLAVTKFVCTSKQGF